VKLSVIGPCDDQAMSEGVPLPWMIFPESIERVILIPEVPEISRWSADRDRVGMKYIEKLKVLRGRRAFADALR